jgi:predicted RNase H-like HicB family nuclease
MKYDANKYTYRIEWSNEDQLHIARCLEFPSLAAHGKTPEKALKEIEFVVNESICWIEEEGGIR